MREVIINERIILKWGVKLTLFQILFLILPFILIWGWSYTLNGFTRFLLHLIFWLIPIIILHEGLHGLVWAFGNNVGLKSIKFGFNKELLAPYTHCKVPLNKWVYISGGVAPLLFLGIIPSIISFIKGNPYWYLFSQFAVWSSLGDIISCYYLLRISPKEKVRDHPEKLGFIIM